MAWAGSILRAIRADKTRAMQNAALVVTGIVAAARRGSFTANFRAAIFRLRHGDYGLARQYLQRAIQLEDGNKAASWELAKLLLRLDRSAMAPTDRQKLRTDIICALSRAAHSERSQTREPALLSLAEALYAAGRHAEAITAADRVLAERPCDLKALVAKAKALIASGEFSAAAALISRISELDPLNGFARKIQKPLSVLESGAYAGSVRTGDGEECAEILVAVGSGIGDMLHVTPSIRNIARRTGRRVDLLVFGDHAHSGFLLNNSEFVAGIWPLCREVVERRYKAVLATSCFGSLRFPFRSNRILWARDWNPFRPEGLHETILNLEAAKELLGISYDEADRQGYFVGDLVYRLPEGHLVGIHAGSKDGRWISKRWPYFSELAIRLRAHGFRVASFGTTDEYIPGTEDRTGGTIEQMCRSMLDCAHFVSNDSGPMHIAAALGMPVTVLFAPTNWRTRLPLMQTAERITVMKACSPCEVKDHAYFAAGLCRCIGDIPVETVEDAIVERIRRMKAWPDPGNRDGLIEQHAIVPSGSAA